MDKPSVWVAFCWDFSAIAVFDDELKARQYADTYYLEVRNVPFGEDIRRYVNQKG